MSQALTPSAIPALCCGVAGIAEGGNNFEKLMNLTKIYSVIINSLDGQYFFQVDAKNNKEAIEKFGTLVDQQVQDRNSYSELLLDGELIFSRSINKGI